MSILTPWMAAINWFQDVNVRLKRDEVVVAVGRLKEVWSRCGGLVGGWDWCSAPLLWSLRVIFE